MNIGRLREVVTIQELLEDRDDIGGVQPAWQDLSPQVWAGIQPLTPREKLEAQKIEARLTHKITLRLPNPLNEKRRIKLAANPYTGMGERLFQVYGVPDVDEKHFEMCVWAMEVR